MWRTVDQGLWIRSAVVGLWAMSLGSAAGQTVGSASDEHRDRSKTTSHTHDTSRSRSKEKAAEIIGRSEPMHVDQLPPGQTTSSAVRHSDVGVGSVRAKEAHLHEVQYRSVERRRVPGSTSVSVGVGVPFVGVTVGTPPPPVPPFGPVVVVPEPLIVAPPPPPPVVVYPPHVQYVPEPRKVILDPFADALGRLKSRHDNSRRDGCRTLGRLGDHRAVPALMDRLKNDDEKEVRQAAAWALGELRDPRARTYLERAATYDRKKEVREAAVRALSKLDHPVLVEESPRILEPAPATPRSGSVAPAQPRTSAPSLGGPRTTLPPVDDPDVPPPPPTPAPPGPALEPLPDRNPPR